MYKRLLVSALAVLALFGQNVSQSQTAVTLTSVASPASGQPGVTSINVTGSGFPAGTILPANTTVSLQPAAGGPTVTTAATAVTTITGSTRRVTFIIPSSIAVTVPTAYRVAVAGVTSTGVAFASSNTATVTANPPARLSALSPNKGEQGQSLTVTITGEFTNFTQGSTRANFGAGISVGGAAENALGPITVANPTTATAQLVINPLATVGIRSVTVQTGVQQAMLPRSFSVIGVTAGPNVNIVSSDPYSQKQLEVDASANPLNPNHIFSGFIDYQTIINEPGTRVTSKGMCGFSFSSNGGKTWKNGLVDVGPDLNAIAKCGDPAVAWDTNGHAFYFGLVQLADANSTTLMYMWRFRDPNDGTGQLIPEARILVDSPAFVGQVLDKGALIFQPDPTPGGSPSAPGTLYACYVRFDETKAVPPSEVVCAISRDGGLTFSKRPYSGSLTSNNGTVMASAPNGGIYLSWRAFSDAENGHYFVIVQPNGSATAPVPIVGGAGFYPYDAPSRDDLARSEGFGSMASDGNQRLLLVFQAYSDSSKRMAPSSPTNSPRIFGMYSTNGGVNWSQPAPIDYGPHGNTVQFMPRATSAGTVFSVIYYDGRNDRCYGQEPTANTCSTYGGRLLNGPFPDANGRPVFLPNGRDRRFDLRVMQGKFVGSVLTFGYTSTQVTRYETRASDHQIPNRNNDPIGCNTPECAAVNLPFLTVGSSGFLSWMGDYIAHVPKVQFIRNASNPALPAWRVADQPTDPHAFLAFWSDFREVAFPLDSTAKPSINGNWPLFLPAGPPPADPASCANPQSRDVNVMFSEITDKGLSATTKATAQRPGIPPEFTVNVTNLTPGTLNLRLEIQDSPLEDWSTVQTLPFGTTPTDDNFVDVKVVSNSSSVQTIYYRWRTPGVNPTPGNPVLIKVYEITKPGGTPIANGLMTTTTYNISYTTASTDPAHDISVSDPLVSFPTTRTGSFTRRGQPSNNLLDNNLLDNNLLDNNLLDNNLLDNNLLDNNLLDNNLLDNNLLDNSLVEDLQVIWTTTGGGALSTATRGVTNISNGQDLLKAGWKFQLLFYQTQNNPKVFACTQLSVPTDVLLSAISITTPNTNLLDNYQISNNLLDNNLLDNNLLDNSPISDQISNATFSVDSEEEVKVALRAYKPAGSPLTMALTFDTPKTSAQTTNPTFDTDDVGQAVLGAARDPVTGNTVADFNDPTPPLVTPVIVGTLGTCLQTAELLDAHGNTVAMCVDGWYDTDVNLSWLVRDPTSGIMSTSGCDAVTLTNETSGTSFTCTATNNDTHNNYTHTTSVTVTIRIDKTRPTINSVATKADLTPYTSGTWTNQNVTIHSTCIDPPGTLNPAVSSGVVGTCPADIVVSTDSVFPASITVTDLAGNVSNPPNTFTVRFDKSVPVTTLSTTPATPNGTNGFFVTSPVTVNVAVNAAIAGAASLVCTDTVNGTTTTVVNLTGLTTQTVTATIGLTSNIHEIACNAVDAAGNTGPSAITVKVDAIAPDTTITNGPAQGGNAPSNTSFEFTGTDVISGVASFECQLDNGAFTACTSPRAFTGLANGAHTFAVRARDAAGNTDATPATRNFTVITSASILAYYPFEGTPDDASGNGFTFVTRNVQYQNAALSVNGIYDLSGSPDSYKAQTPNIPALDYANFTVSMDFYADADAASRPILVGGVLYRWIILGLAANRELTVELNNHALNYGTGQIINPGTWHNLGASLDATARILRVFLDGQTVLNQTLPENFQLDVIQAGIQDDRIFTLEDYSNASAYHGLADNLQVYDRALSSVPAINDLSNTQESLAAGPFNLTIFGNSFQPGATAASSNTAVATLDNINVINANTVTAHVTPVAAGTTTFFVTNPDGGRAVSPAFVVNTTLPAVNLTIPVSNGNNGYFVNSPVNVGVTATDAAISSIACTDNNAAIVVGNLNGIGTSTATGTLTLSADGTHNLSCVATNSAGTGNNGGANSATVKIDTVAPDTTLTDGPDNGSTIYVNNPTFFFTGTDSSPSSGGPLFECRVDIAAFAACTSPNQLSGLLDGSHTFSVRGRDSAGNVDATPASRTFTTASPSLTTIAPASAAAGQSIVLLTATGNGLGNVTDVEFRIGGVQDSSITVIDRNVGSNFLTVTLGIAGNAALGPRTVVLVTNTRMVVTSAVLNITATPTPPPVNYDVTTVAGSQGAVGSIDGTGTLARFFAPIDAWADGLGNLYVAGFNDSTVRKVVIATGQVTTIAGQSNTFGIADGVGSAARFNVVFSIWGDGAGNLYITDTTTIRKLVLATGEVTTFAGMPATPGSNDGVGSAARFNAPRAIWGDGQGNLFVADSSNHIIRKIVIATREVTTIAGTVGVAGNRNDTGLAATFNNPRGIWGDANNLYVTSSAGGGVRQINRTSLQVTTLAGGGGQFQLAYKIVGDGLGNLYVTDLGASTIRRVVISTGQVTTVAGIAGISGSADGPAATALFNSPAGVAYSGANLFIAEINNHSIRRIALSSATVTTMAGFPNTSGATDANGTNARFNNAEGVFGVGGNLYIADQNNHVIRRMVLATGDVTTLAGLAGTPGGNNGTGSGAQFNLPVGLWGDATNLYVIDSNGIRKIVIANADVSTLATSTALAAVAGAGSLSGIAGDGQGNLYVSYSTNTILKVAIATGQISILAGSVGVDETLDGTGQGAHFSRPVGLWSDGTNLFVSEATAVRMIAISNALVTTLAGSSSTAGSADGVGAAAQFGTSGVLAGDGLGNLFVKDGQAVRKIVIATKEVTTIAGANSEQGSADGPGSQARFVVGLSGPGGIWSDGANIFVGDSTSHAIRRLKPIATTPPVVSLSIPEYNGNNGFFITSPVNATVSATDAASTISSFTCTDNNAPISVGNLNGIGTNTASGTLTVSTDGNHNLSCVATNGAGNTGNNGGSNAGSMKIDTTAPTVSVTSPASGETATGTVSLTSDPADTTSGIAQVQYFVDGNSIGASSTGPSYSVSWNSTTVPDGSHTLTAKAFDAAGNSATSAGVNVIVDNIADADLTLGSNANPVVVWTGGTLSFGFTVTNQGATPADNVTVTATLPAGFSNISCAPAVGTCSVTNLTATASLGTVAPAASVITFIRGLAPTTSTPITITAAGSVTTTSTDTNNTNNQASSSSIVNPLAGPLGGMVLSLAIDPTNPNIVYAGTDQGGVFKSNDAATNWISVRAGFTPQAVRALVIDPTDPSIVYAASSTGIVKTTNAANWSVIANTGLTNTNVSGLTMDPTNHLVLYAGTAAGIFKTIDGGNNWASASTGLNTSFTFGSIAIDPTNPNIVYAASQGAGVYKSINGGGSWTQVITGLSQLVVRVVAVDPVSPGSIYAGTSAGLFKSTNAGANWAPANTGLTTTSVFALLIPPTGAAASFIAAGTAGGVFTSDDEGATWGAFNNGLTNTQTRALAYDAGTDTGYVGTGWGVYKVPTDSETWSEASNGIAAMRIAGLAIDPTNPSVIHVANDDNGGMFKTSDGGASWGRVSFTFSSAQRSVVVDPSNPLIVYAASNAGVIKSVSAGVGYLPANTGITNTDVRSLAMDPLSTPTLYAGTTNGGLFKTTNGGTSWTLVNSGISTASPIASVAVDPTNSNIVYAGSQGVGVYKSTNGGATWTLMITGLGNQTVNVVAINPTNTLTVYAGTPGGLYKSTDGGSNWALITSNALAVNAIAFDPSTSTLFVGSTSGVSKAVGGGAFSAASTGLTRTDVRAFALHPTDSSIIYAGTLGGGVFKSADAGNTWQPTGSAFTALPAQLVVNMSQSPSPATAGGTVLYSLNVINYGGTAADNVTVNFTPPTGMTFVSCASGIGNVGAGSCIANAGVVTATLTSLSPATTFFVGVTVAVPSVTNQTFANATVNVSTTSTQASTAFNQTSLSAIFNPLSGPPSASVVAMVVNPSNTNILLAGTASDGVFRSTDGGANWTPVNGGLNGVVRGLVQDPFNANTVYAGTSAGVFVSFNGGRGWFAINTGLPNTNVTEIAVDPLTATLYAGTAAAGIFRGTTTNGVTTWTAVNSGLTTSFNISAIVVDPLNAGTLYAATQGAGVFKSVNNGGTWTAVVTNLTELDVRALAMDPVNSLILYAATSGGGIFKTVDGGTTWNAANGGIANFATGIFQALLIDSNNPLIVYAGANGQGIFKSINAGTSWTTMNSGMTDLNVIANTNINSLVRDPNNAATLYAGTGAGVFKTANAATSWTASTSGLNAAAIQALALDPTNTNIVYTALSVDAVYKSGNGGTTWSASNNGIRSNTIRSLAVDPSNTAIVYAGRSIGATTSAVAKTTDGGFTWTSASSGALTNVTATIAALAIDPSNTTTVYAGGTTGTNAATGAALASGVFKTTDGGTNWASMNTGLVNTDVRALVFDGTPTLYVGTFGGGVFKSVDGAANWTQVINGLTNLNVISLASEGSGSGVIYAGTSGGGIFKTTNGGTSWTAINSGVANLTVQAIAIDKTNPSIVYAGTGQGVIKSTNGGTSWASFSVGLGNPSVLSIAIDPATHTTLYAATSGVGLFKSVDSGATWQPTGSTLVPFPPLVPASITATAGTPQSRTVNTAFTTALQATVRDANNSPVGGIDVTFNAPGSGASGTFTGGLPTATVTTNSSGVAIAPTFTANTIPGSYNLTASVAGVATPANFALTNTVGPASSITLTGTPQSTTVNTAFPAALQATVKDQFNNLISNLAVTFAAPTSGARGTFTGNLSSVNANTNSGGVATAPTFTANTITGSYNVSATVTGLPAANFALTNLAGAPASISATAGTPQSVTTGTNLPIAMQATVRDNFNNGVNGATVTFTAPGSGASGTFSTGATGQATTNSSGVATSPTFTTNSAAGTYTVNATVSGVGTAAAFNLTNVVPVSDFAYTMNDQGGLSKTAVNPGTLVSGYASIVPNSPTPAGYGLLTAPFSIAAVNATSTLQNGRMIADVNGPIATGISVVNPNNQSVTVSFFFTDATGTNFGAGNTTIGANQKIAAFFNQAPFNGGSTISGTFTFSASLPVAAVGLRGFTNEAGNFLLTTLTVADLSAPLSTNATSLAAFADGGGYTEQVNLVNVSDAAMTGNIQFFDQFGSATTLTANGQTANTFSYSIPARSLFKLTTAGGGSVIRSGSVRITPTGSSNTPNAQEVLTFISAGVTLDHVGLSVYTGTLLSMPVDGPSATGISVASAAPVTVTYTLSNLDGTSAGTPASVAITSANGSVARFVSELFPGLPSTFKGVLKITAPTPVSAIGLRVVGTMLAYLPLGTNATSVPSYIPHVAVGGGFGAQFDLNNALSGQITTGHLRFTRDDGTPLSLGLEGPAPGLPPSQLSLTMTQSPNPVTSSGTVLFSLTVANIGAGPAENVSASLALPASMNFVSCLTPVGTCGNNAGTVTASLGTVTAGNSVVVQVTAMVNAVASQSSANATANVSTTSTQTSTSLNQTSSNVTLNPLAGPPSGQVFSFSPDPTSSNTILAGTNFGVFRTTDGGTNWMAVNGGISTSTVRFIVRDPVTSSTVYASTSGGGVFKSTNNGSSWSAVNTGLTFTNIFSLAADPLTAGTFYAGTSGSGGVFKTVNSGGSWTAVNTGLTTTFNTDAIIVDPSNPSIAYAATQGSGIFKTTNGGNSWTTVNGNLTILDVRSLAFDPTNSTTLYAGTLNGGIFKSTNSGGTWTLLNSNTTSNINSLLVDRNNPSVIYAATAGGVLKSADAGANWTVANSGLVNANAIASNVINALVFDPSNSQTLYAGTGVGVFKSVNAAGTWNTATSGIYTANVSTLTLDPLNPAIVFASGSNTWYKSVNGGATWNVTGVFSAATGALAIDPTNTYIVYAGRSGGGGVDKSVDGGFTFVNVNAGAMANATVGVSGLAIDPSNSTVYAAARANLAAGTAGPVVSGVFKSTNGASTWTLMNAGLTNTDARAIVIDPSNPNTLYVATFGGGVFKTTDGATTWSPMIGGLTDLNIISLAIDRLAPGTVYAGANGGIIFKTTNGGTTWSQVNSGSSAQTIAVDPTNSSNVYAGTFGGILKTTNGGTTWVNSSTGLSSQNVVSLAINPATPSTLYAGSNGAGAFKSLDSGATWQPTSPVFAPWPTPASVTATAGTPQGTPVNTGFPTALKATVKDGNNNLLSGVTVTFTTPSSGASATFAGGANSANATTNGDGVATAPALTANSTAGSFNVAATVAGVATPANFSLTNNAPAPTLIHYYDFNGNVNDQAGTENGTLQGGSTASGGVLALNGSTGYVQFGSHIVPQTGSYSVSMFARETGGAGTVVELISQGFSGGPGFYIGHDALNGIRVTDAWLSTGITFPSDGQWHHYALVNNFTSIIATLYVDGVARATHPSITTTSGGTDTRLGRQFATTTEFFNGYLSNVRIYQGALSAAEVAALANQLPPPSSITATVGNGQSAPVNTAFSPALQATVTDSSNSPVVGVTVTFTAPTTGASGTFPTGSTATAVTNGSGIATAPTFTANGTVGSYTVTASVAGVGSTASFNLTNNAASGSPLVYFNDFENAATAFNGLTMGGTLTQLTRFSLPTDSGGLGSPNQSMYLGRLGLNVAKSSSTSEIVNLALTGLTPGTTYNVSFKLFIGGSWDGSAGSFGPDQFRLRATSGTNTVTLVDATFSNCGVNNQLCGASSPQSYSDATPTPGPSGSFAPTTGSDYSSDVNQDYSQDYAGYVFGSGTGNPVLSFVAGASTATLIFERLPISSGDSADEYWGLDDIGVTSGIVTIANASFETATLSIVGNGTFSNLIPDSTISPTGGTLANWTASTTTGNAAAGGFAPSNGGNNWTSTWWTGNNIAYLQTSSAGTVSLSQTLSNVLQNNTSYRLSALIGRRSFTPRLNYSLQLWAGTTLLASASNVVLANNTSATDALIYNSGANNPAAGQPLRVVLSQTGAAGTVTEAFFDDISLTTSP